MRASITLVIIGAAFAAAQSLSSLPECGQTCIKNMLAIAPSLGCASGNVTCYCTQPDFGYGIRDCSIESCPTKEDANAVISFGTAYCKKALSGSGGGSTPSAASATSPGSASASAGASASSSGAAGSGGVGGGRRVPITTSTLSGVEMTGGKKVTTATGTTTIYGVASLLKSTETTGGSTITTVTGRTTLTGAKASAATSKGTSTKKGGSGSGGQTSKGGSGSGNSAKSSTSSALALVTAVPGLIGAVVIAVLAL